MNDWISIRDKFPEDTKNGKDYLVTVVLAHKTYQNGLVIATARYYGGMWYLLSPKDKNAVIAAVFPDPNRDNTDFNVVTHWMPLPKPPAEFRGA